jgi:hypothetical protein
VQVTDLRRGLQAWLDSSETKSKLRRLEKAKELASQGAEATREAEEAVRDLQAKVRVSVAELQQLLLLSCYCVMLRGSVCKEYPAAMKYSDDRMLWRILGRRI